MFPITITLHNGDQLNAVMAALHKAAVADEPAISEAPGKSAPTPAEKTTTAARSPRTAKVAEAAAPEKTDAAPAQPAAPAEAAPPASTAAVDYPTLQKAVAKLFAKDAKAPVQIAKDLGFDTFKAMPADKWGAALDAVNAKLAELEIA